MSKIRAYSIMAALFLTNLFCLFQWAVASKSERSWQEFAIAQDAYTLQLEELIKGKISTDLCEEHPI